MERGQYAFFYRNTLIEEPRTNIVPGQKRGFERALGMSALTPIARKFRPRGK
jgi:hypothetical protein